LQQAHNLLGAGEYDEALEVLGRMRDRKRTNVHEKALIWQTYGYVYSSYVSNPDRPHQHNAPHTLEGEN
jgi:hypothetical protein